MQLQLWFNESFMIGFMIFNMILFIGGFILTEVRFKKVQAWKFD